MSEPLRVIEGTMKPHEAFWVIRDSADGESVDVEFDGVISEFSWWGDEVTPKAFKDELYAKGQGRPVNLLVNSPGGEVIAASVIRSTLQEYPGHVTADIIGMALSAATIVVTGADHIRMRDSALFMIHDPSTIAMGTVEEMQLAIDTLKTVKDSILDVYETRTKMDRGELAKMMKKETWMSAKQAKEMGFVDEVVSGSLRKAPATNMRAGFLNCLTGWKDAPAGTQPLPTARFPLLRWACLRLALPHGSAKGHGPPRLGRDGGRGGHGSLRADVHRGHACGSPAMTTGVAVGDATAGRLSRRLLGVRAWAWLAACGLALLWNTRHENILIVCLLAAYAVLFLFFRGQVGSSWRNSVRILLPVFWIFLIVIFVFTTLVKMA